MKPDEFKNLNQSETSVSKQIADNARDRGFLVYRMNAGKVKARGGWIYLNPKSTPDRLIMVYGFPCWVEVKKNGEKATGEQIEYHEMLVKNHNFVITVDSLEQFEKRFAAIERICLEWRTVLRRIGDVEAEIVLKEKK